MGTHPISPFTPAIAESLVEGVLINFHMVVKLGGIYWRNTAVNAVKFYLIGGDMNATFNILCLGSVMVKQLRTDRYLFVLVAAFISLAYAWWSRGTVLKKDKGTEKMQEIWNAIRIGANSYLNRHLGPSYP